MPPWLKTPLAFFVLACALSLGLRCIQFTRVDIWQDEANEVFISEGTWGETVERIRQSEMRPPLRYFFLKLWLLGGNGTHYLRLPSLLFSVLATGMFYLAARMRFEEDTARIASVLMACASFPISSAHFCRSYSMDLFVTVVAVHAFLKHVDRADLLHRIYLIAASVVAAYTTYFFDFVLLLFVVRELLNLRGAPESWKEIAAALVPIGVLTSPLLFLAPEQIQNARANAWHSSGADAGQFVTYFQVLTAGRIKNWDFTPLQNLTSLIFIGLALVGARRVCTEKEGASGWLSGQKFFFLWFAVPVGIIFLFSLFSIGLFTIRTMIIFSPAFYLLAGLGIVQFKSLRIQIIPVIFLCGINIYSFTDSADLRYITNGSRKAAEYITAHIGEDEWVVHHTHFSYFPFRLYQPGLSNRIHQESVPWHWGAAQVPADHFVPTLTSARALPGIWYVRKMNDYKEKYEDWKLQLEDLVRPWNHNDEITGAFIAGQRLRSGNLVLTHYTPRFMKGKTPLEKHIIAELRALQKLYTFEDPRILKGLEEAGAFE
ncbi:MAG: glycosyltransferase family 39 protein [Planctomycetota bacterium]|nr:glycosyltransferase family 39 protein [Planctomycetota bacterium]MDP7250319.1 glycosyltransferase family 39 protein [Planctomycetota bacterium]